MNIGINALSIRGKFAGIGVYTKNLIKALSRIDKKNRYILFLNPENFDDLKVEQENFENLVVRAPFNKYYIWEQIYLPLFLKKNQVDILHGPRAVLPLLHKGKSVVTILDLAFLRFPNIIGFNPINYWPFFVRRSVCKADHVISISENTKKDIVKFFNTSKSKITVTHLACDNSFRRIRGESKLKRISQKYTLPDKYILSVGTIEPRKNLNVLLQALHILRKEYNLNLKLVIAGKKGWLYSEFFDTIKRLELEDNIIFTGYVPEEDLPAIYNLADVFVYPSKYEGFGLPLLEAMSCGVPVIASNTSSIPEVLGDSGLLYNSDSAEQICNCILEVFKKPGLREKMVFKGLKRIEVFSWEKTAKKTLRIYETIYDKQ